MLRQLARSIRERAEARRLAGRSADEVFEEIYRRNHWRGDESISGTGSDKQQTARIVEELPRLLRRHGAASMLDIPCGDFNWMSRVDLAGIEYIGGDIVPALVESNTERYARPGVSFRRLDLMSDPLPPVDIVFCRDCLVHFSLADARRALANIAASGSRFLLTTTFPEHPRNRDIPTGLWRELDLESPPFMLGTPLELLNEGCTEGGGTHRDKSLGLWPMDQVREALRRS
jgi:SAM-dependent methyltransferase